MMDKALLTKNEIVSYLLSLQETEGEMRGVIRTKDKCLSCMGNFKHFPRLGYICPKCKTTPKRFFIDLWFNKRRIKVYSDKTGQPLDGYKRALNLLLTINAEINNHTFDPSKYIKTELQNFWFCNIAKEWLQKKYREVEQNLKSLPYVKRLESYVETYFNQFFGTQDIREIRKYHIEKFRASLPTSLSPKTVKNLIDALRNIFNSCYKDELIERVPAFPVVNIPQPNWKWIGPNTQVEIIKNIPEYHRPIFAFLFLQGCRPGEARALKVKDVDLENQTITIRRTFSGAYFRETTKQKKQHSIPIHPEMLSYIENVCKNSLPEAFVFTNKTTGSYYRETTLRRIWKNALKNAKLEYIKLYNATRHSFASQLVNAGIHLNVISNLLGHSNLKMTQRYAHENIQSLKTALEKVSMCTVPRLSPASKWREKNR